MALSCAISNEVPEHPCVSPSSNCVFERRLIEKYIAENGVDPVTNEPLTEEQLIDIKVSPLVKPKPPSATSIPAILKSLQDEWDATMLHSFSLRQQLQTARQELSHALYQHDAACRVIARLTKEVTAAREALATLKPQAGIVAMAPTPVAPAIPNMVTAEEPMEVKVGDEGGMTEDVLQKLQDKATTLTSERKKKGKKIPEGLASAEDIRSYKQVSSHLFVEEMVWKLIENPIKPINTVCARVVQLMSSTPVYRTYGLHSASNPGILALDLHALDTSRVLTGGLDKNAVVFQRDTEQIVATLKGHSKKVTSVVYHPTEDVAFTASPDATIRVWSVPTSSCTEIVKAHDNVVTGISLHATGDYLLSCSLDQHWAFSDIRTGRVLTKCVSDVSSTQALTCAQFHPDGLIFGTGTTDSIIKIWDLKERANVANFPGHSGPITSISFSENGYYLATSADDSVVKLWDLRKLKNFKTIALEDRYEVKSLCFDQSGVFLAVAGSDVQVYMVKQWELLKTFTDHSGVATGVKFGKNASFLASTGMDRNLKFYS